MLRVTSLLNVTFTARATQADCSELIGAINKDVMTAVTVNNRGVRMSEPVVCPY